MQTKRQQTVNRPLTAAQQKRVQDAAGTLAAIQMRLGAEKARTELAQMHAREVRSAYAKREKQDTLERIQDHARLLQLQAEEERLVKALAACRDAQKGL